jgi:hypothetical protein
MKAKAKSNRQAAYQSRHQPEIMKRPMTWRRSENNQCGGVVNQWRREGVNNSNIESYRKLYESNKRGGVAEKSMKMA